jgi:hypothetical protein
MRHLARLLLIIAVGGCGFHRTSEVAPNANVITFEEITASGGLTILDVISKLHPEYLRDRGGTSITSSTRDVAVVFLNDQEYGALSALNDFPAHNIEEVRFVAGHEAVVKFGPKYSGGVIQLITRVD